MAENLEGYRAWLADSICPVVRGWCPDVVERRYRQASDEFVGRTADEEASRRYARACPVPGIDHALYRLRELTLPGGVSILAGVHFRGRSTDYPFVGVFAQSRWLTTKEVAAAHGALMHEFSRFSPRATWWWSPTGRDLPELATVTPDRYLVMGSLEEIRKTPPFSLPWIVRPLFSATEISAAFAELYESFHRVRPDLAQAVPPTKIDDLAECATAGGLYGCYAGADLVGAVAVKPDSQYGVDAWLMWDIVLARQHCGKGLGPALQRAVLDRLDLARGRFVVGTIHAQNLPSLRTALRVGRQIVGTWFFIRGSSSISGAGPGL